MLFSLKQLRDTPLSAQDGEIGVVHDFLFDDATWHLRYLVADTSPWLKGRKVLLSPSVVGELGKGASMVSINLTRKQIETSPDIDTEKTVSRQQEEHLHRYFGWPYYWNTSGQLSAPIMPVVPAPAWAVEIPDEEESDQKEGDPHLQSEREVEGYHIEASDGRLGHVEALIIDTSAWKIRYLVVDTKNWWPGKKVLVATHANIGRFSATKHTLNIGLSREKIKACPEYDPTKPIGREYETRLNEHYGWPAYWDQS